MTLLSGDVDYLILNHNVLTISESNTIIEKVYSQSDITDAILYHSTPIIIGKFMNVYFVRTLKEDGSELENWEFEDEEENMNIFMIRMRRIPHQNTPICFENGVGVCGSKMWIPGEYVIRPRDYQRERIIEVERKGRPDITIKMIGNALTIQRKTYRLETGINQWIVDEKHNRILLLSKITKKIYIYDFDDGLVNEFLVGFDDEVIEDFVFNPLEYQLHIFFSNHIRMIQFGK